MDNGEKWYVKSVAGKVFGPIDLDTLKKWVRDGRVEPLAGVSNDLQNWTIAPMRPELEMNWVVENNPGQFYGPTHKSVVDDLKKSGALTPAARFYCDDRGAGDAVPQVADGLAFSGDVLVYIRRRGHQPHDAGRRVRLGRDAARPRVRVDDFRELPSDRQAGFRRRHNGADELQVKW